MPIDLDSPTPGDLPPHHPENFRRTYKRARHYVDTLPPCPLNPAPSGELVLSVTTLIRRAWPSEYRKSVVLGDGEKITAPLDVVRTWNWWTDLCRNQTAVIDHPDTHRDFLSAAQRDLDAASARGQAVHDAAEDILAGRTPRIAAQHAAWLPHLEAAIDELGIANPITERAVFGEHAAGAFDCLTDDRIIDWKSRGEGQELRYRETEIAQIGAYASASYYIDSVAGQAVRVAMPKVRMGVVVLVGPDGHQLVPVDIERAIEAWHDLVGTWTHRSRGEAACRAAVIKTPKPRKAPAPVEAPADSDTEAWAATTREELRRDLAALDAHGAALMRARLAADGLPRLADCTPGQLAAVERHLADVLRDTGAPFHSSEVPATTPAEAPRTAQEPRSVWQRPDDGGMLDEATEAAFVRSMRALPDDVRAWVETRLGESLKASRPIRLPAGRTVRQMEICRALVACAALDDPTGELVRHLLAAVLGTDMALMPACTLGQAFGSLTIDEARTLERAASAAVDGAAVLAFDDDGRPVLAVAA